MDNKINITSNLQTACYDSYLSVVSKLRIGISELEIANEIRNEMTEKGISEYWYDLPIMVLIGSERFLDITKKDYSGKSPNSKVFLKEGDPIYIDIHPQDKETKIWGDWNSMLVYRPRRSIDDEQVAFLEEIRTIQREGIAKLRSNMTASDVANYFLDEFKKRDIILADPRNNVGHSMHKGPKLPEKRIFLEKGINQTLGEGIYAIEPGGYRLKTSGKGVVVGRFEEVIYLPKEGRAEVLGKKEYLSLIT